MGRRVINFLIVFLFLSLHLVLEAQTEEGILNTNCVFEVQYTLQHPACPEEANGSIDLELINATGTTNIEWLDGVNGNASFVSVLNAGNYTVRVGDDNLCYDTLVFVLVDPAPVLFDLSSDISCPSANNGAISVTLTSGNADAFAINGGIAQSSPIFSDLAPGTHTITVFDPSGCYYEEDIEVAESEVPVIILEPENASCSNVNDASFIVIIETVSISENFEYSLDGDNYVPDSIFEDLNNGIYEVYVRNQNLCVFTESVAIVAPEDPEFTIEKTDVTCPGADDASFIVLRESVNNTDDFEYSLDGLNFQSDSIFSNLEPDLYSVYIKNSANCVFEETIFIEEPEAPLINFEINEVSCPGGSDASFIVIIETVSTPEDYEYSLDGDNYIPDSVFSDIPSGIYTLYTRDQSDCIHSELVEIVEPETPVIDAEINDVLCPGGEDGSFIVIIETVSSPEPYLYSLDGDIFQPDSSFTDLDAGVYEVIVQDTTGCEFTQLVEVEEPEIPNINADVNDVLCPGGEDGSFIVIIETVSSPEPYLYSIDGDIFQSDSSFTDLDAGVYEVIAQNMVGCEFTQLVEVEEPEIPNINVDVNDVLCPGGEDGSFIVIIETVSSPEPYLYSIDGDIFQPDSSFTGLDAGVYEVIAQNTTGCEFTQLIEIEEPEMPNVDFEIDHVTCPDGEDASFIVIIETVSNTGNFEFSLNGNEFQEDSIFTNLEAGVHDVVIKNEQLCLFAETIVITEPETPVIDFDIDHVTCSGGNDASFIVIIETVSNTENYEYSIGGDVFQEDSTFTDLEAGLYGTFVRDMNGCISTQTILIEEPEIPLINFDINEVTCSGGSDASLIVIIETVSNPETYLYSLDGDNYQIDSTFTGLTAGVYTTYIQNEDNCVYTEIVEIIEPEETDLSISSTDISCHGENDGTISVIAEGPGSTFEYSIDGLNFQNSNVFENLPSGIFEVTIQNGEGCLISENTLLIEPDLPEFNVELVDVSCSGGMDGSITVNITSGILPFEFALDTAAYQTSNVFENLSVGAYTLYLLDDSGCVFSNTANLEEPPPLNALTSSQNETCDYANGWISVAAEGGTFPYNYQWDTQDASPSISDLSEGTFHLSITDGNYCLFTDSIIIRNEPAPTIEAQLQDLNCFEDQNAWINLIVESDAAPFDFIWSNGESVQQINDLSSGAYSVTVTDQNNCFASAHFSIEEPEVLQVSGEKLVTAFSGDINLTVEGGQVPYDYLWSNGQTTKNLDNLPFGFYSVTVTDSNDCERSVEFSVLDPNLPVDGAINVYPTVTDREVTIDIQLPEEKKVNIYLVDEVGRIVQVIHPSKIQQEVFTLDLESLAASIYFLRIEVGADFIVKKVVKVLD